MHLPNPQKGVTLIIFLILIALGSVGIVGGSLILKQTQPKLLSKIINDNPKISQSKETPTPQVKEVNPLITDNIVATEQKQTAEFQDKILFSANAFSKASIKLGIANSNGDNLKQILPNLTENKSASGLPSPDNTKILFLSVGIPTKLEDYARLMFEMDYYISDISGNNLLKIDKNSLKAQTENSASIVFSLMSQGWSQDSKKLIFLAYKETPQLIDGKFPSSKVAVYEYNIENSKATKLFETEGNQVVISYYDPLKKVISYTKNSETKEPFKLFMRDLNTDHETELKIPYLHKLGKYMDVLDQTQSNLDQRSVKVYSIDNLNTPKNEIKVPSNEYAYFEREGFWSPSYNYYAIFVRYNDSDNNGHSVRPKKEKTLNIYSSSGEPVSTITLNDTEVKNNILFDHAYQKFLFSPSEDRLLIASNIAHIPKDIYWRVIDVKTGKEIIPKFTKPDLGIPFAWY